MLLRLLCASLILFYSGAFLHAEEAKEPNKFELLKKDVYFQPGGGLRFRYDYLKDATGGGFPNSEDDVQAQHRAHIDLRLYKGEYIETFFRLLHFADWGDSNNNTVAGQPDSFQRTNGLLVNEAWGLWKVDDTLGLKFGRAPLHLGLGYTYGHNDWFNVPYTFDQFDVAWDWESVELSIIGAKVRELDTVANQTLAADPEENHYIVNLDVKNLADAIRIFTFNLVQVNRDLGSSDGGTTVLNGLNMQRLSIESEIIGKNLFGSLFVTFISGEEKVAPINIVNGQDKLDIAQSAFDFKFGYNFPEYSNLKFWAGYHVDSGDKDNTDSEAQSFDSFYYEVYGQSGLMDMIRWGNLTFFRVGMDVEVAHKVVLGAEWFKMERTEVNDNITFGQAGRFYQEQVATGNMTLGNSKDIGTELDIWGDYEAHSGVKFRTTFSMFFPGEGFKEATTSTGNTPSSQIMQLLTQVSYEF